jgi:hypothetical protein
MMRELWRCVGLMERDGGIEDGWMDGERGGLELYLEAAIPSGG